MMPIIYTPVVGEACRHYSHMYRRPRGLYISYNDRARMEAMLANVTHPVEVIVVTECTVVPGACTSVTTIGRVWKPCWPT